MSLKEAFRYQNKLQSLLDEAQGILDCDANVTKVANTYLRHKVMPEAEDETVIDAAQTEYAEQITDIARLIGLDASLARELWADTSCREAQLLAPMIMPSDAIGQNDALKMIKECVCVETTDILCHNAGRETFVVVIIMQAQVNSHRC